MDKIEKLLEMQKILDSISEKMFELKEDLNLVALCVENKKLIPTEVSRRVIAELLQVNNLNEEYKKLYTSIELSKAMTNDIKEIKVTIAQAISDIEMDAQLAKYKRFLFLETDDADTKVLLDAKKADMQKILDNYTTDRKKELEPYGKFIEAILEKDSTKLVSLMLELSQEFGNELLGKAIMMKTIKVSGKEEIKKEEQSTVAVEIKEEKTVQGEFNAKEVIEKEIEEDKKLEESIVEPTLEEETSNATSDIQNELIEKGLLITEEVFDKPFYALISDTESKKIGTKIFINDMRVKNTSANVISLTCISKHNFVTPELVAISSEASLAQIEMALDYLQNRGYVRKYGVNDIGSFYCMSPRCIKALQSKDARAFLKLKGMPKTDDGDLVENSLNPVLTRVTYSKLLTSYLDQLGNKIACISNMIWGETFACRILSENKEKAYIFTGTFFKNAVEADEYINNIKNNYFGEIENVHIIVASINQKFAKLLAEYLIKKLELDCTRVYCYSLTEDKYFKFNLEEEISFIKLFEVNDEDGTENDSVNKTDTVEAQICITDVEDVKEKSVIEDVEEYPIEKPEAKKENVVEPIMEEKINIEEDRRENKEEKISIDIDGVMKNAYQMIANGKTYCATTYLRSVLEDDDTILETYEKLAYAVNAPWMRCSYNSQKIFTLYSTGVDAFTQYLMVAASLRTFFMNHVSYDYTMKSLHANVKGIPVVSGSVALTNAIYSLVTFKESVHKGVDAYAAYRIKDNMAINRELDALVFEAKSYYGSYITGQLRNHKNVKRFIATWKMIFANNNDLANYLQAIIDKDYEVAELAREYLVETFISNDCSPEYSNLDMVKLNKFIDEHWDKANTSSQYKTTALMGDLRNNLINAIEKVLKVMCDWIVLVEATGDPANDEGAKSYMSMKKALLEDLENAVKDVDKKKSSLNEDEVAGALILKSTIKELVTRIEGTYDENQHKYYYIDFLRGKEVLLDNGYLPDMRGKFADFEELSLSNRILRHSQERLMSFEEKLEDIFNNYGDDYGTAELIIRYLEEVNGISYAEKYNIRKSEEQAEVDAKIKLDDFIENLELAQSYGQIEETKENKKEKIQKIANEWFEYAKESKNYGFFNMILDQYRIKIHEDAKVRGKALLKELAKIKEQGGINDNKQKRIDKIQEMIDEQNYTVAEDLLSRINIDEPNEEVEISNIDYLQKFIDEYDYNYKIVANSSRKLSDLVNTRIHNKDDKGAKRLIDNWMANGQPLGQRKLTLLLDALGFVGSEVKEQAKIGKVENYIISIREAKGRKINYKHPIAAFGSKAGEDGFRVVCLFGKYDADRLIEEFKNIASTKNTLILLDYALPLSDRRRLARKIKSDLSDKVFAVLDRVLLMFLVNNYSVQFINQILMSAIMPFSYCQPYVWDSSKVMPPEIFMGRKDELEKIESPAGVNIVYGGRQLGKSALLKMAKMNIDNDENHDRAVFIEIKGLNYERAAKKIGHELYDAGILDMDIDTTDWDDLSRAIKRRLQDDKLPYIPYLLLLLDEADVFIESCEEVNFHPFDALKEIQSVDSKDRFKFVIAGLHNIIRFKRDAALSNNSVLTHLTAITIKPFDKREAKQLLERPLYYLGLRFPKDKQSLVSLILANTNYFPGLIQLYCANLIEAMRKNDYAGYDQVDTPVYEVNPNHIKKVLSDTYFMNQIREKFEITLKLDEDNMYYIIALLMAYLYHQNANSASESEGFSAKDIIETAKEYSIKKVATQSEAFINGLMQELLELNILRQTISDLYLFSRYSFFQMMGTSTEVEDKLEQYMED